MILLLIIKRKKKKVRFNLPDSHNSKNDSPIRKSLRTNKGKTHRYDDYISNSTNYSFPSFSIRTTLLTTHCNNKDIEISSNYIYDNNNLQNKQDYFIFSNELVQKPNNPETYLQAINSPDADKWIEAMESEMDGLISRETYHLVPKKPNMKIITLKWVYVMKQNEKGEIVRYKARLCARGFNLKPGFDFDSSFSPVARMSSLRLFLALCVKLHLFVKQFDINNAYLNADLDIPVYSYQPEGFQNLEFPDYLCEFDKAIYGLPPSGRLWHDEFRNSLKQIDFKQNETEPCIFYYKNMNIICIILIYVDDVIIASNNNEFINSVKAYLDNIYGIKDLGELKYFLGIEIKQNYQENIITLSQKGYIEKVCKKYDLKMTTKYSTPLPANTKINKQEVPTINSQEYLEMKSKPYREIIGSWIYLCTSTRPDISYAISQLAKVINNPSKQHWNLLLYLSNYIMNTSD